MAKKVLFLFGMFFSMFLWASEELVTFNFESYIDDKLISLFITTDGTYLPDVVCNVHRQATIANPHLKIHQDEARLYIPLSISVDSLLKSLVHIIMDLHLQNNDLMYDQSLNIMELQVIHNQHALLQKEYEALRHKLTVAEENIHSVLHKRKLDQLRNEVEMLKQSNEQKDVAFRNLESKYHDLQERFFRLQEYCPGFLRMQKLI